MTQPTKIPFVLVVSAFVTLGGGLGCETALEPSSAPMRGYTFAQELDLERRTLRIGLSSEDPVECLETPLPVNGAVSWKSTEIDPELHDELVALATDEALMRSYLDDTAKVECNEWNCATPRFQGERPEGCTPADCIDVELCIPRPEGDSFCYLPEASALVRGAPWRFSLTNDEDFPPLTSESQALIDAFRTAHDACWND